MSPPDVLDEQQLGLPDTSAKRLARIPRPAHGQVEVLLLTNYSATVIGGGHKDAYHRSRRGAPQVLLPIDAARVYKDAQDYSRRCGVSLYRDGLFDPEAANHPWAVSQPRSGLYAVVVGAVADPASVGKLVLAYTRQPEVVLAELRDAASVSTPHRLVLEIVEGANKARAIGSEETVLETLEGFVEGIEGKTAFVRLKSDHGDTMYGQCPAAELRARRISERRRFKCLVKESAAGIRVDLEPIPDKRLSDARLREIRQKIDRSLRSSGSGDDY